MSEAFFLRNIQDERFIHPKFKIRYQDFLCREIDDGLSITLQGSGLTTVEELDAYRMCFTLNDYGDCPGVCKVRSVVFTQIGLNPTKTKPGKNHPVPDLHHEVSCLFKKGSGVPPEDILKKLLVLVNDAEKNDQKVGYFKAPRITEATGV